MPEAGQIKRTDKTLKVIISGGGTGGHVFPAIAIANEIKSLVPDANILFVGAKGKIEMEKVPKAGYPIKGLWISGFHRKLTTRNLLFPFKLISSLTKAFFILRRFKPDVVVGVGGYASGAVLEVAARLGIPTLIQEQNSYAGATNRILANKVNRICVAYEGMERFFPKDKIVLTGNPVRKDLIDMELTREEGIDYFNLDSRKKTVFVFGGSLGAQSINEAMAANADLMKANPDVQILWQVGKIYYERFSRSEPSKLEHVHIKAFVDRMDLAYTLADVIICRAGALTIAELCLVGKPAILIPSPNVAEDHQTQNAMSLADNDAAVLVRDVEAPDQILKTGIQLLNDKEKQNALSAAIKKLARPQAAERIAEEVLNLTAYTSY